MPGYFYVVEWHDPMPGREDAPRGLIEILKLRSPLLGVTGLPTYLTPFDRDPSVPVHLVGDAMAFAYAGEVHYKVVFDVPPADDAVRAWLGESLDAAPASDLVVINANEVARLRRTYGTPPLPPEVPGSGVMTMGELRSLLSAAP